MKSEERHKLYQNDLAKWMESAYRAIKPYLKPAGIILALLVVIMVIFFIFRESSAAATARANEAYQAALMRRDVAALEDVASQYSGTIKHLAHLAAADIYLAQGCEELFVNKATAANELRKALERYKEVQETAKDPHLLAHATFGLGKTYEALSGTQSGQGQLDSAIEQYRKVIQMWPTSPFSSLAQRRVAELERHDIKAFYDRFARYDPQPEFRVPQSISLPEKGSGLGLAPPAEPEIPAGSAGPSTMPSGGSSPPWEPAATESSRTELEPGISSPQPGQSPAQQQVATTPELVSTSEPAGRSTANAGATGGGETPAENPGSASPPAEGADSKANMDTPQQPAPDSGESSPSPPSDNP